MKLQELINKLQDIADSVENPENIDVVLAMQPSYPLESTIANVCTNADTAAESMEDDFDIRNLPDITTVYIAEGTNTGYAPRTCWNR